MEKIPPASQIKSLPSSSKHETSTQCWPNIGSMFRVWWVVGLRCQRRWYNVNSQTIPANTLDTKPMLAECWSTVCDAGPTLSQHWLYGSCKLRYMFAFCQWHMLASKRMCAWKNIIDSGVLRVVWDPMRKCPISTRGLIPLSCQAHG